MKGQIEVLNNILRDRYNVHILLNEKGEFLYRMTDINQIINCNYSADRISDITLKINGCRYYKIDVLKEVFGQNVNGVRDIDILQLYRIFDYDIESAINSEALSYIKNNNIDLNKIIVVIFNGEIRFKFTTIVEDANKRIWYSKYLKRNLIAIKSRKERYIDIYGVKLIDFIENNNIDAVSHLSKYNKYFYHDIFRDDIFFKIRRFTQGSVIYYNASDLSHCIKSFTSVAEFCKRYIADINKAEFGSNFYISQENVYEAIGKANTIISLNLCNKYKIKNDFYDFGELTLSKIEIAKKELNYIRCENGDYLFKLKNVKNIINYKEDSTIVHQNNYYIYENFRVNKYIDKEAFEDILSDKIKTITPNNRDIVELVYKLADHFNIKIKNQNKLLMNEVYIEHSKILSLYNDWSYMNNKFNLRLRGFRAKKDMKFLDLNNKLFVIIGEIESKLLSKTKSRFGKEKYKMCVFKDNHNITVEKVLEFDMFEYYLSRMKNDEAIEIRESLGIPEKYIPILEHSTIPIFENVFPDVKFKKQYKIKNKKASYRIDLAIPKMKIGIECDEFDHCNYDKEKERVREEFLEALGWTIIRYNPASPQEIGQAIRKLIDLV